MPNPHQRQGNKKYAWNIPEQGPKKPIENLKIVRLGLHFLLA